ncbi:hypothetical protein [Paractinoplanes durhamensis]|uniref:Secreted protein n=1 Tax=Paractinoplanes durhamensis TaxID=113563 RepID=A0ABQ3YYJ4_9ACTN|nr:hypothetical protein [Actinoplanes durhamensis]GIE02632.1 hypothetical protein Adu01nite_39820 [Actinoplanes durhamensis]
MNADRLRGSAAAKRHNARTIAALTGNPGCERRSVLDAAGVDKVKLAETIGFAGSFGQSRFALARGNAFEAMLKADDCALLRSVLDVGVVDYQDLGEDTDDTLTARHGRTRELLASSTSALIDHPLLTLSVAGQTVFLEPDLIAFQSEGRLRVVEIKSFAIVDDQADAAKVSAAAVQAAVYVLALRDLLGEDRVSHEVVLVCPENFSLQPAAVVLDVRKQLSTLKRQLSRLSSVSSLIAALPPSVSFDMSLSPETLISSLEAVSARYVPECLSSCEMSVYCRHEASGTTAALGRSVRESLGGVDTVALALDLSTGAAEPTPEQDEAAALLRTAARLRASALAAAGPAADRAAGVSAGRAAG